jgi:hypothetical protein
MVGGLLGIVIANGCFPLLDRDAFLTAGLCAFFAPVVLDVVSSLRKRLTLDAGRLQRAYLYAGAVTIFLALFIACNGALDKSPVTPCAQRSSSNESPEEGTGPPATPSRCPRGDLEEPRKLSVSTTGRTEPLRRKSWLWSKCTADFSACRGTAKFCRSEI